MTIKAFISDKTWRSRDYQLVTLSNYFKSDMPAVYEGDDDFKAMLRSTNRSEKDRIYVVSLGVLGRTEKEFTKNLSLIRKRKAHIISMEDCCDYHPDCRIKTIMFDWKAARKNGAAKVGGTISADKKKAASKAAADKIRSRWPLPSNEWATATLLKEAGISLNTAKAHLGKRPIAQYNYQAALKRKARREGIRSHIEYRMEHGGK